MDSSIQTKCAGCKVLMVEPVTLPACGHSFCLSCAARAKAQQHQCPECKATISADTVLEIDLALQQKIISTVKSKPKASTDQIKAPQKTLQLQEGLKIGQRYVLTQKIAEGSFGKVYECERLQLSPVQGSQPQKNQQTQQQAPNFTHFAIKFEQIGQQDSSMLYREISVLKNFKGVKGFAQVLDQGKINDQIFVVFNLLGPTLYQVFKESKYNFSRATCAYIFRSTFALVRVLHAQSIIHRDLKLDNFLVGSIASNYRQIHVIDFGLSKYVMDREGNHISFTQNRGLIGNIPFASLSSLQGNEQSRRDDLESLCLMMIYLLRQSNVPWYSSQNTPSVREAKSLENIKLQCENLPPQIFEFFQYVRALKFQDAPDYAYLHKLIEDFCTENQLSADSSTFMPDWAFLDRFASFSKEFSQQSNAITTTTKHQEVPQNQRENSMSPSLENIPEEDLERNWRLRYPLHEFQISVKTKTQYEQKVQTPTGPQQQKLLTNQVSIE